METFLTGPNLMVLGLMIWSGLMIQNTATNNKRSRNRDADKELQSERRANPRFAESQIQQWENQLLDFNRDVSARVETTLNLLDQFIAESDREIIRLETLLEHRQAARSSLTPPGQRRMVVHLARAGYSINEIAKLVDRNIEEVQQDLEDDQTGGKAA